MWNTSMNWDEGALLGSFRHVARSLSVFATNAAGYSLYGQLVSVDDAYTKEVLYFLAG